MSYQGPNSGGYPPPRESESQYPPPPGEEDDRARSYHARAPSSSSGVTLPSISPYDPQYAQPQNGYPPDPRAYPHSQDQYGPPGTAPYRDDRGGYSQQDYGRGSGGSGQQMAFAQSAPRQRTAIACRYCRRRKIRCSGFDQNPEGRCSNCQRFQQECIFTPVSSQAQAFVPVHAAFPHMRPTFDADGRPRPMMGYQGTQLYGAHGQPLGAVPPQAASPYNGPPYNGPPQGGSPYNAAPPPAGSPYNGYAQPSPTSSYSSYSDDRDRSLESRKRPQADSHPSILPPPLPGQPNYQRPAATGSSRRPAVEDDPRLPPITPTSGQTNSNYSPNSSTSSHSNLQPPHSQSRSSRTPPPRVSPSEGNPMSMGNILQGESRRPEHEHIDRGMLSRLDGKRK